MNIITGHTKPVTADLSRSGKTTTTSKLFWPGSFRRVVLPLVFGAVGVWAIAVPAAALVQEFYLPMPEPQIYQSLSTIQTTGIGTTQNSIYSVVVTGDGTVIHYDQWEDGYEISLGSPAQSTTRIWGDGNNANGIPPGMANDPVGIPAGTVIALTNNVPLPRNPATVLYDGRDRIGATKALVVVHAGWPASPGPVFAGAVSVLSTIDYGTEYISPVGQDLTNNLFKYVGLFVMAAQDNTVVAIDPDGPGTNTATSVTLNRGESYLFNGGIKKGGRATATKPVQANLIIGKINGNYAADWFTLYPVEAWDDTYYTPVGSSANGNTAYVYLYNPNTNALTINYTTRVGSGSFSVPASNGGFQFPMPATSGAKFTSAGGQTFNILETVAAKPSADTAYNWGFTPVPKAALTTEAVVGWGPGSANGTVNGNPAWVTPLANTTVYVDYKGDRAGPLTDPNGNKYDTNYVVTTLQSKTVFDPSKNQSGMRIYTVDGTLLSAAWGQDPDTAAPGNPYIDAGTTVLPFPVPTLTKTSFITNDIAPTGLSSNDVIQYTVKLDNKGLLPLGNTVVIDTPSGNLVYVTNSTTLDGVPIPDSVAAPYFPLAAPGYTIPIILRAGSSTFSYRAGVIAGGIVSNSVNVGGTTISSQTAIAPPPTSGATSCGLNFTDSGGGAQSAYVAGADVYVTLADNDQNTATNSVQSTTIVVRNNARNDLETLTLTETGTNTGVFRNTAPLPTSLSAGLAQQDNVLNVVAGDSLTVTNLDAVFGDVCTAAATIQIPALNKVLYLSDPGQALDRIDPGAAGDGTTATSTDIGPAGGSGVITLVSTNTQPGSGNSMTMTNITVGGGSDQMLLVAICFNPGSTVSSMTYSGQALAFVAATNSSTRERSEIWRLLNPPVGTTNVVITSTGTPTTIIAGALVFSGVDQTTPFSRTNMAAGNSTTPRVTIVSATGERVFNLVGIRDGTAASTTGSGQVEVYERINSNNLGLGSITPGAASVTNSWSVTAGAYWASVAVSIKPAAGGGGAATNVTSFTQSPAFCSAFVMPSNNIIAITNYITLTNGSLTATPAVTATLRYGTTNIFVMSSPTYTAASNRLVWQGTLSSNVTIPAGAALTYVISNGVAGTAFHVDYDSTNKPSKIILPTSTVIDISTLGVYDASYPGGSLVASPIVGDTLYVRAAVADPFGSYDITSLGLAITAPDTNANISTTLTNTVADDGCTRTYEYVWNTPGVSGGYSLAATAHEGTEGITDVAAASVTLTVLDTGTPSSGGFGSNNYPANGSSLFSVEPLGRLWA